MAKQKKNKVGQPFAGAIGGVEYFRNPEGKFTDSAGQYVGDGWNKKLEKIFPQQVKAEAVNVTPPKKKVDINPPFAAEPAEEEIAEAAGPRKSIGKKLGKAVLRKAFPTAYENVEALRKFWKETTEKEEAEKKRERTERRLQFTTINDNLKDNNDLIRDLVSIQERSATLLTQIAESVARIARNSGSGFGGNPLDFFRRPKSANPLKAAPLVGESTAVLGALGGGIAAIGGALSYSATKSAQGEQGKQLAEAMNSSEASGVNMLGAMDPDAAMGAYIMHPELNTADPKNKPAQTTTPTAAAVAPAAAMAASTAVPATGTKGAPLAPAGGSIAASKETAAVAAAKTKQTKAEDILTIKADEIRFNSDKLSFDVQTLTIESKQQNQQQTQGQGATGAGFGGGAGSGAGNYGGDHPTLQNAPGTGPLPQIGQQRGQPQTMQLQNAPMTNIQATSQRVPSKGLAANQQEAYQALRAEGLSEKAARIAVANLSGEALSRPGDVHADPSRSNPYQKAHGIASWDDARAARIAKQFGKMPNEMTVAEQAKAFAWELKTYYKKAYSDLTNEELSDSQRMYSVVKNFEAPARPEQDTANRLGMLGVLKVDESQQQAKPQTAPQAAPESKPTATTNAPAPTAPASGSRLSQYKGEFGSWEPNGQGGVKFVKATDLQTYKGEQGRWEKNDTGGAKFVPAKAGDIISSPNQMVDKAPAKPAAGITPASGGQFEEKGYFDVTGKTPNPPTPKANKDSNAKPHPRRVESHSPQPSDPGGNLVFRIAALLPYLAIAAVTGEQRAAHSIMQNRRRRY